MWYQFFIIDLGSHPIGGENMPFLNRNGDVIVQCSVWIPDDLHKLVKADHLNLSAFVREQLEALYSDGATIESLNAKFRLIQQSKESRTRRRVIADKEAQTRERLYENVRQQRQVKIAAVNQEQEHENNLRDAWETLLEEEEIELGSLHSRLPENDVHGDWIEFWPKLALSLSSVNGDTFDEYEVIAYAKLRCSDYAIDIS